MYVISCSGFFVQCSTMCFTPVLCAGWLGLPTVREKSCFITATIVRQVFFPHPSAGKDFGCRCFLIHLFREVMALHCFLWSSSFPHCSLCPQNISASLQVFKHQASDCLKLTVSPRDRGMQSELALAF